MPQDKMLNIPNYSRRNANLKDTKKSVPTCHKLEMYKEKSLQEKDQLGFDPGSDS